jgi:hypothetical protein
MNMTLRLPTSMLLGACALLLCITAHSEDTSAVFARFKAASGGTRWDNVHSLRQDGTLSTGGLAGTIRFTTDLRSGRSTYSYKVGPVDGAAGFDGHVEWERSPSGEVTAHNDPAAMRIARSQAWLDARGYWYAQRHAATYENATTRTLDGNTYGVVVATPDDGDPVTLWFADGSGLLARIEQPQNGYLMTTVFDDYRDVDGVLIPFHFTIDQTDAAGRTDPRNHEDVHLGHVSLDVPISDRDFAMPVMAATARINDASRITRVPFDLISNHIYVDGFINGKPARLMVDTGASNLLTPAAAKKFGLVAQGKLAVSGAGEQNATLALARGKAIRLGAATLDDPVFHVVDLGNLAQIEGVPLDGLVGYEMFRRFDVRIDYANRQLTLSEPEAFAPPPGATVVPFDFNDTMPVISGTLDGLPVRLSVDTGSRDSLTMSSPFVRAHDLVAKYAAAPEAVIGWGVGGAARGRPARFGTLKLGDLDLERIAGDLFVGDKGAFTDPNISGNLGGGVLHRFTVTFDYANKKMYLVPNAAFGKPYGFDRSGLWLLDDDDALKVVDVAMGSAAQRSALRVNDRITSIGGETIAKRTLVEWRRRLRELPAGTKLTIKFLRDGKPGRVQLVLADRMSGQSAVVKRNED